MKKTFTILLTWFFSVSALMAQKTNVDQAFEQLKERGEIYFKINQTPSEVDLNRLSKTLSLDRVTDQGIYAYANTKEFTKFLELNINFDLLTPPSMRFKPHMRDQVDIKNVKDWDFYPTYEAYEDMMEQFAATYPDLCELETMTTLPSGRKLLILHINNDLSSEQNEPEFLYTSTMHGDEVTGYVLMLRYIDYLLSHYGNDPRVTNLVNNIDIWINPLANPDGTYAGGNNTVYGATRSNGNGVDLNRNYPDPDDGEHPDGENYQPETEAFMQLAEEHNFVMSANFHGGAEVVNYPWDTWARLTADNDWWIYVSREYADTVHANSTSGYMTELDNGITNGYAWYPIAGGRQDYMNYFRHCREVTVELSYEKTPPANELPDFWNYNYRSLLNYMEQCTYGIRGLITNSETNQPVEAKVYIENHDIDESEVYSSASVGDYHRLIKAGTYDVTYSAFGYHEQTIQVTVQDHQATIQNVVLEPIQGVLADFHADHTGITPGESINFFDDSFGNVTSWSWSFPGGTPSSSNDQNPQNIQYNETGTFSVTLIIADNEGHSDTLIKESYIVVSNQYTMSNSTVELCNGLFYDTGGENGNYSTDEDFTMTFKPAEEGGKIKADFVEFDVEEQAECNYDYLKIYDGAVQSSNLIGTYCGSTSPGTVEATNDEGILTFVFHSDFSITGTGWKAIMSCTGTSVGVKENHDETIIIYPNPATNSVQIQAQNEIEEISVFDLGGKELEHFYPNGNQYLLNTQHLEKGIYILHIVSDHQLLNKKLIIQ